MYSLISGNDSVVKAMQQFPLYYESICSEETFEEYSECVKNAEIGYEFEVESSPYNIHVSNGLKHIVYNTLSNALYIFENSDEYDVFAKCEEVSDALRKEFIEAGLWVKSGSNVKEWYRKFIYKSHMYWKSNVSIVLTTTLACNAKCFYCYENGVRHRAFDMDKFEGLVSFIKSLDLSKGMQLIWFGGEPLMNTKLIDKLSARLQEENINYFSYLVTNGSLLSTEIIEEKLQQWHVSEMQITLDGTEDVYEAIKNYADGEKNHYGAILKNIGLVAKNKINVNIRMNICQDNKEDIFNLLEEIDTRFKNLDNVSYYPAFLAGIDNFILEEERVEVIKTMLHIVKNPMKMTFSTKFYSVPKISPCHKFSDRAFAIDINGNLYTCEHNVGRTEYSVGNVSVGLYEEDRRKFFPPLRAECKECIYLPKCCGGCDSNYQNGDIACMAEKYMLGGYLEYLLEQK